MILAADDFLLQNGVHSIFILNKIKFLVQGIDILKISTSFFSPMNKLVQIKQFVDCCDALLRKHVFLLLFGFFGRFDWWQTNIVDDYVIECNAAFFIRKAQNV
jgi:hypothetical protein